MTGLTTAFDAALAQDEVPLWWALELILHDGTPVRLLSQADQLTFSAKTFVGQDDTFGVFSSCQPISDGVDTQAPRVTVGISVPTAAAAATLCNPANQGASATIWCGSINMLTGAVIDSPDAWFVGEIDVPTYKVDQGSRVVEIEIASVFERLFDQDEGARLTNAFHQYIWPAEIGLEFVTDVQVQMPWGQDAPRPVLVRDVIDPPPASVSPGGGFPFGGGGFPFGGGGFFGPQIFPQ